MSAGTPLGAWLTWLDLVGEAEANRRSIVGQRVRYRDGRCAKITRVNDKGFKVLWDDFTSDYVHPRDVEFF